ncbi:MAG TPA: type II toxin-antitoxin system PemK/MazF family toxin [Armatimonadota bacterium]|nr:type II toxin-antitoxin system PemK/MazF family toxin [Armatimonadota bacterium]
MPRQPIPLRGDVWLVSLDPTIGHEIQKTRPAVIVSSDLYNRHNWVVLVMPLTSDDTTEYDQVFIRPPEGGLTNPRVTLPDQLRAVDRQRLVRRLGHVSPETMRAVDRSLKIVLDLA